MPQKNIDIPDYLIPAGFLLYLAVNVLSWPLPFFWDTLLTSTITDWFYTYGFGAGIVPTEMDAGHPPLFYAWLLLWWKMLGPTLLASHFALLPFLWIMFYQFVHIASRTLTSSSAVLTASALFFLETTILAQSTMVSYDIVLLCFYLFGLRYLLDRKPIPVAIACVVLSLISIRGVIAVGALAVTEWWLIRTSGNRIPRFWKYLPALFAFALWNLIHYLQTGWMLFTPAEQWSGQRGWAGPVGWLKNTATLVRIHLEPGRLVLFAVIAWGLFRRIHRGHLADLQNLMAFTAIPLIVFAAAFIPFGNPIGHRYFMMVFALAVLLFTRITQRWKHPVPVRLAAIACLISGHFWIWPTPISNGWDASLAHLPYFGLKAQMDDYLYRHSIHPEATAAHFPIDVSEHQARLTGSRERPQPYESTDTLSFVLVSNISNDYTPEDMQRLETACVPVKSYRKARVWIRLYDCSGVPRVPPSDSTSIR